MKRLPGRAYSGSDARCHGVLTRLPALLKRFLYKTRGAAWAIPISGSVLLENLKSIERQSMTFRTRSVTYPTYLAIKAFKMAKIANGLLAPYTPGRDFGGESVRDLTCTRQGSNLQPPPLTKQATE